MRIFLVPFFMIVLFATIFAIDIPTPLLVKDVYVYGDQYEGSKIQVTLADGTEYYYKGSFDPGTAGSEKIKFFLASLYFASSNGKKVIIRYHLDGTTRLIDGIVVKDLNL